jgi:L-ascorbate metabolism protein UlaG (beta-lactamase superfamily)
MAARITYIHHDCFILEAGNRTLLFDYPAPGYLPQPAAAVAAAALAGSHLTVFASHSHDDHFDPAILAATAGAASRQFIVSDDVADLYGHTLPPDRITMEPEDRVDLDDMAVTALESNDLGLAYLIEMDGLTVYFGGDMALWDWPGNTPAANRAVGMSWRRLLGRLEGKRVDLAFSNTDPRLPDSLCGAPDFLDRVRPRVFVPMHLGGHVHHLDTFAPRLTRPGTTLFHYAKPGATLDI